MNPPAENPALALRASGLSAGYADRQVLRQVSIEAGFGELVAIVGPNGAGKSTLLKLLARTIAPWDGSIELLGKPIVDYDRRELARTIAVVGQENAIAFQFTVLEAVLMGRAPHLAPFSFESPRDLAVARAALEQLGLTPLAGRYVQELSGGERKRVVLARALAQEPKVALLDEPTAFLDLKHIAEIFAILRELRADAPPDRNRDAARSQCRGALCRSRVAAQGRRSGRLGHPRAGAYGGESARSLRHRSLRRPQSRHRRADGPAGGRNVTLRHMNTDFRRGTIRIAAWYLLPLICWLCAAAFALAFGVLMFWLRPWSRQTMLGLVLTGLLAWQSARTALSTQSWIHYFPGNFLTLGADAIRFRLAETGEVRLEWSEVSAVKHQRRLFGGNTVFPFPINVYTLVTTRGSFAFSNGDIPRAQQAARAIATRIGGDIRDCPR